MKLDAFGGQESLDVAKALVALFPSMEIVTSKHEEPWKFSSQEIIVLSGKRLIAKYALASKTGQEPFWSLYMNAGRYEVDEIQEWIKMDVGSFSDMLQMAVGSIAEEVALSFLSDMTWDHVKASIPNGMPLNKKGK